MNKYLHNVASVGFLFILNYSRLLLNLIHSRSNHLLRTSTTFIITDTPLCSSFLKLLRREFILCLTSFLSACWKIYLYILLAKLLSYRSAFFLSLYSLLLTFHATGKLVCSSLHAIILRPYFPRVELHLFAECMFTAGPSDDKRTSIAQCHLQPTRYIALYDNLLSNSAVLPIRLSVLLII